MSEFHGFVTPDGDHVDFDFPKQWDAYRKQLAGEEVTITMHKRRSKRSSPQNKALHACLCEWVTWLKREKNQEVDVEQLKDDLLALQWGYVVRQSLLTGEIVKELVKPHTSLLNTQEFAELFDTAVIEAAKTGFVMTLPDEFKARKTAEQKRRCRKAA